MPVALCPISISMGNCTAMSLFADSQRVIVQFVCNDGSAISTSSLNHLMVTMKVSVVERNVALCLREFFVHFKLALQRVTQYLKLPASKIAEQIKLANVNLIKILITRLIMNVVFFFAAASLP
jgi:hypothetical protein